MLLIVMGLLTVIYGIYFVIDQDNYKGVIFGGVLAIIGIVGRSRIIKREKEKQ